MDETQTNLRYDPMPLLNPALLNNKKDVMGFLNEAMFRFPDAISLASGRPSAKNFDLKTSLKMFDVYVKHRAKITGKSEEEILNDLGQYNKAQGFINEIVAKYLEQDENIKASPDNLIITVGAQEAMMLALTTICHPSHHSIAIENPSYIGISTYAEIAGYPIVPISSNESGLDVEELTLKLSKAKEEGKPIRLLYTIPDHQNPSGNLMALSTRNELLKMAKDWDFYILEDNAYGSYTYEGDKIPTIKSLDSDNRCVYIGSFSKTIFPSLRLAVMVAGQQFEYEGKTTNLSSLISRLKGYVTLNTPAINQAILGGYLIENNYSLLPIVEPTLINYRQKYQMILDALDEYLTKFKPMVNWNKPRGGFFLTLNVPFIFTDQDLTECAQKFGVICCPMSFFYINGEGGGQQIRLAFSNLEPDLLKKAIYRLSLYIESKIKL